MTTRQELREKIAKLPRVALGTFPTPLQELPRLSDALGGPHLWIKRDDQTGLAFGGNKTRMFEFLLAEAVRHGVDTVIGGAGVQSNYCRQLAAACRALGLEVHLVLRRIRGDQDDDIQGNLLLDLLLGAAVHIVGPSMDRQREAMFRLRDQLKGDGKNPLVVRMAQSDDLVPDVVSYAECFCEILEQAEQRGVRPTHLFCSSYDTTQAGLELANATLRSGIRIVGISPASWKPAAPGLIVAYANQAAIRLGLEPRLSLEDVSNTEQYVGEGYGRVTQEGTRALKLLARTEGILLDPVYTSKAFVALLDHIQRGSLTRRDVVVFLHTGGTPALFAYADDLDTAELRTHLDFELETARSERRD